MGCLDLGSQKVIIWILSGLRHSGLYFFIPKPYDVLYIITYFPPLREYLYIGLCKTVLLNLHHCVSSHKFQNDHKCVYQSP